MSERIRLTDEQIQAVRDAGPGWCGADTFEALCVEIQERRSAEREQAVSADAAWRGWAALNLLGQPCSSRDAFLAGYAAGKGALLRATATAAFQEGKREAEVREREWKRMLRELAEGWMGHIWSIDEMDDASNAALKALVRDS